MEVTMETGPAVPSPLSQSFPASPTGSRKRAFQEIEGGASDRKRIQMSSDGDNQENDAPKEHKLSDSMETPMEMESDTTGNISVNAAKETTPVPSVLTAISIPNSNTVAAPLTPQPTTTAAATTKKPKLSPASKQAKMLEKEAKERQKLEDKAKKEEEKRVKEEEKKKREAEREEERKKREEKKKIKEEEKVAKEEEKRKKEEEKMKKEKAQLRLNAFFAKPATTSSTQTSTSANLGSPNKTSADDGTVSNGPTSESAETVSDYKREFPDFFLQSYTKLAPVNRFERDLEALGHIREKVDRSLKSGENSVPEMTAFRPSEIFNMMPYRRRRGRQIIPVKEIISKLQESHNTIDLIEERKTRSTGPKPQDLLKNVTMKTFRFGEDVRPPYQGTYTRRVSESSALKLSRNPFQRALPDTNYDYDSEAEWEEPEEGEDLDSEGEEELSEDGDDDMEGFLDDDGEHQIDGKRRLIVGDLEPVSSGIRWQEAGVDSEFQVYKIEIISEAARFPIDPFSNVYWEKSKVTEPGSAKSMLAPSVPSGRSTLHAYAMNPPSHIPQADSAVSQASSMQNRVPSATQPINKAKRSFPPDQLSEFKQVVAGSDLTKTGLIEILKKRFPKVSKDVLKDTLNSVAVRIGQKEADKKWVCR